MSDKSIISKVGGTPRRTMVLFLVVDTSGSMEGAKIGAVNAAIDEVIPLLKELSDGNTRAEIKVAILEFSSGTRWLTQNGPMELDSFYWSHVDADGVTDFGEACKALNEKLSTKGFMRDVAGYVTPAILLMSDGGPTDDWQSGLNILKQNGWFKVATRIAIAIGDDANTDVLKDFTGNIESVTEVHNIAKLKDMIKFLSVRASEVATKGVNVGDSPTGTDMGGGESVIW